LNVLYNYLGVQKTLIQVATKLEIKEIRELSGKSKTVKEIKEKLENFTKLCKKLKFLVLKKFNIYQSYSFAILST